MNDDPDDLAAVFFAQQAAKERKKATLPTDDWIRVIEANKSRLNRVDSSKTTANEDSKKSPLPAAESVDVVDPVSWLVTTMPSAAKYHEDDGAAGTNGGVVGIVLDSNATNVMLSSPSDSVLERQVATVLEEETRNHIKQYLVQQIHERVKALRNNAISNSGQINKKN